MNSNEKILKKNKDAAIRVSNITIILNIILSVFKIFVGVISSSVAMISDGVHSASDVFSTVIVIIGVSIAGKKSDNNHPYGHERFESIASIVLCVILGLTGLGIGYNGLKIVINASNTVIKVPGVLALFASIISIIVKGWMFIFTIKVANNIKSSALKADAYHHLSDSLSSIGAFIGIAGARLGIKVLDPLASMVICIFILKACYDISKDAVSRLVDKSCDQDTIDNIILIAKSVDGVIDVDNVKTRIFGPRIYVDIEISADGSKSLNETHMIAENVNEKIQENLEVVKDCMVHVNPGKEDKNIDN